MVPWLDFATDLDLSVIRTRSRDINELESLRGVDALTTPVVALFVGSGYLFSWTLGKASPFPDLASRSSRSRSRSFQVVGEDLPESHACCLRR